jgi:hypothetical protein
MLNKIRYSAYARGNHRSSKGHRFQHHVGSAFGKRRVDQKIACLDPGANIFFETGEENMFLNSQLSCLLFEIGTLPPFAEQNKQQSRSTANQIGNRLQEIPMSFFRTEPAGGADAKAIKNGSECLPRWPAIYWQGQVMKRKECTIGNECRRRSPRAHLSYFVGQRT